MEADWVLDAGAGPGRFTHELGGPRSRRVALDLSLEMLRHGRARSVGRSRDEGAFDAVRADLASPPFAPGLFGQVVLLGNLLGYAAERGASLLHEAEGLVTPDGVLLLEIAPGPGERSRYLARLPPSAVGRLLASPPGAVVPRVLREGFVREPWRHRERGFRRWSVAEIVEHYRELGWTVGEVLAVAPALGPDRSRLETVAGSTGRAWKRLLEVEERLGRLPPRWAEAAAVLVAVRNSPPTGGPGVPGSAPSSRADGRGGASQH